VAKPQPWSPADATSCLNTLGRSPDLDLHLTRHALDQMADRDLIQSDVLAVLRRGFVYEAPVPSTRNGLYKYKIQTRSPNSGAREVRLVVVPDLAHCAVKVVTAMWVDEPGQ
jgi:hypothetical protein